MSKLTTLTDVEVYPNYFCVGFMESITGKVVQFEMYDDRYLNCGKLRLFLRRYRLVTFNGTSYDLPIIALALAGYNCEMLKKASDAIINQNLRHWQFEKAFGVKIPTVDHVDLIEVAPGIASLKIYGGRLHAPKMQDLPYDHDDWLMPEQMVVVRRYNANDLGTTRLLLDKLTPQIELRERMSDEYGIDLRSKSDAQIAEAVLAQEVGKLSGREIVRPEIPGGTTFKYKVPDFVSFISPELRALLDDIAAAEFVVAEGGNVLEPPALKGRKVTIGGSVYRMGIGGLHSSETCQAVYADDDHILVDRDVVSYYPAIILRLGLMPSAMGSAFLKVYKGIVQRRLDAKARGDKVTADALKITINGSFGKFGSKWSKLYSPDLLIQTTVTGQLCLLMLIEQLEFSGIAVVSANTDGIVIRCRRDLREAMVNLVDHWELVTKFETEETAYRALYSRDVNNYIAIKPDGGHKLKGVFASAALAKNPVTEICNRAALAWLKGGTPVAQTIRSCGDIRQFVTVRSVKGGAVWRDQYLGKAVRWYYGRGVTGAIHYKVNGYTVARTEGAVPLMDLPDEFPTDIDFDWYERETLDILASVGALNDLA